MLYSCMAIFLCTYSSMMGHCFVLPVCDCGCLLRCIASLFYRERERESACMGVCVWGVGGVARVQKRRYLMFTSCSASNIGLWTSI
jgi:hypothetical protein